MDDLCLHSPSFFDVSTQHFPLETGLLLRRSHGRTPEHGGPGRRPVGWSLVPTARRRAAPRSCPRSCRRSDDAASSGGRKGPAGLSPGGRTRVDSG